VIHHYLPKTNMKLRSIAVSVVMVATAKATTIVVTNVDFTQTNAVVDLNGTKYAVDSGFIGIGVFSITDAQIANASSPSTIVNAFTLFGQSGKFGADYGIAGTYQFEVTAAIAANSVFTGNIYTIIGNASTLAASTQIIVFKHDATFSPDPAPSGPAMLKNGKGTLLWGNYGLYTADIGLGPAPAFSPPYLPEPSTALLGLLGAIGLLRRRR
jgi:hypothetical protein